MKRGERIDCPGSSQVKVCGLTLVDEAVACAELGADAIGMVFYPPSPRFINARMAQEIGANLPEGVSKVGVFVDEPFLEIMKMAELCKLDYVQLHGCEPPAMVEALELSGLSVIKTLFVKRRPFLSEADTYCASAYLVESGEGRYRAGRGSPGNGARPVGSQVSPLFWPEV